MSLKGKQVDFLGLNSKYVSLANWNVPQLCAFTVCVDLNKTEKTVESGTAFSYDISSTSTDISQVELALTFHNSILQLFFLGSIIDLGEYLGAYEMHQICCVWDSQTHLLEFFWDGKKLVNQSLPDFYHRCLRPNGTLVIGHLHKNYNGDLIRQSPFVGIVHYFQMWDHVRSQQDFERCEDGNVVSWGEKYWFLKGMQVESAQHQRCGEYPYPLQINLLCLQSFGINTLYGFWKKMGLHLKPQRERDIKYNIHISQR